MKKSFPVLFLLLIFAILLSSCNLPTRNAAKPSGPDAVKTAAAETVSVQLTEMGTDNENDQSEPGITVTVTPSETPDISTPTKTSSPTATSIPCDFAHFEASGETVLDGTEFGKNESFTKTWRFKNVGTCAWTNTYEIFFYSGDQLGAPAKVPIGGNVSPGQTIDVSVTMTSPNSEGEYWSYWRLRNSSGSIINFDNSVNSNFWANIKVVGPGAPPPGTTEVYDFATSYCNAGVEWRSNSGVLPCPGGTGDADGFVVRNDNPKLQDGIVYSGVALETHPKWENSGLIQGKYPAIAVKAGYHFKTTLGCLHGGAACDVKYQFNYRTGGGSDPLQTFGTWNVTYAGGPQVLDIDLSPLDGEDVVFILIAMANGDSTQDWAIWFEPRIMK